MVQKTIRKTEVTVSFITESGIQILSVKLEWCNLTCDLPGDNANFAPGFQLKWSCSDLCFGLFLCRNSHPLWRFSLILLYRGKARR